MNLTSFEHLHRAERRSREYHMLDEALLARTAHIAVCRQGLQVQIERLLSWFTRHLAGSRVTPTR